MKPTPIRFAVLGFALCAAAGSLPALAAGALTVDARSKAGAALTMRFSAESPAVDAALGALVCADRPVSVTSASLWMDHDGHGHGGPRVTTRGLDANCFQVNGIRFPHAGEWQVKVALAGSDTAVFSFDVAGALPVGTFVAVGDKGTAASITFDGAVTGATLRGLFCSNEKAIPTEAKLWMPDMNHGSSPTTLSLAGEGCFEVGDVDFFMPGKWEVRARFASGEGVVFTVPVSKE
jgi:hypothetical protein